MRLVCRLSLCTASSCLVQAVAFNALTGYSYLITLLLQTSFMPQRNSDVPVQYNQNVISANGE